MGWEAGLRAWGKGQKGTQKGKMERGGREEDSGVK